MSPTDIRKLTRVARRLSSRVAAGMPDDVLWMTSLNIPESKYRLSRNEILSLRIQGLIKPEQVVLGSTEADNIRLAVFAKAKPAPAAKANWLRDACRDWKVTQRKRAAERHLKRARACPSVALVDVFYRSKGKEFEKVLEDIFGVLNIQFQKLDDNSAIGAPDYLVQLKNCDPLIFEIKSKEGDNLVDYNKAVEVLSASEIHGYKNNFCVTLCHPGVDPGVPLAIASCGRLSVVESSDLGEGLLRLCEGTLTQEQLWTWLASPGQALASDLPFRNYA